MEDKGEMSAVSAERQKEFRDKAEIAILKHESDKSEVAEVALQFRSKRATEEDIRNDIIDSVRWGTGDRMMGKRSTVVLFQAAEKVGVHLSLEEKLEALFEADRVGLEKMQQSVTEGRVLSEEEQELFETMQQRVGEMQPILQGLGLTHRNSPQ